MFILVFIFLILFTLNIEAQWQTFNIAPQNIEFRDICVVNQNVIWTYGAPGAVVYKTINGGANWYSVSLEIPYSGGYTISAVDENNAWIATDHQQRLFRTTNGGFNWVELLYLPHQTALTISEIHFFNQNTGVFLYNISSTIDTTKFYITRNGGLNWYFSPNILLTTGLNLTCFGAIDTNFCWVIDDNRINILSGGLENQWQVHTIDTLNPYLLVSYFINNSTGYAGDGLKIFKTTNGGVHWSVYHSDTAAIGANSLLFIPNTEMAFYNGQFDIKISRNNAVTWQHHVNYIYNIDSVSMWYMDAFDTNSVWIAANKGRLFKYNFDFIGIQPLGNNIPSYFKLHQNYPNPFNPVTKIKFSLPVQSVFSVIVYDILGREVYRMIDSKNAGEYEFTFEGATFSSGIYFYKLETKGFTDTKKMILIK